MIVRTVIKGAAMGEEMRNCMYAEEPRVVRGGAGVIFWCAMKFLIVAAFAAGFASAWLIWGRA